MVRDIAPGEIIYEKNSHKRLIPALAVKLVTAYTALDLLGADYRFSTKLIVNGVQNNNVLHGNIIIHGEGDPYKEFKDHYQLISSFKEEDIRLVSGKVITDLLINNSKKWWFSRLRYSLPEVGGRVLPAQNP